MKTRKNKKEEIRSETRIHFPSNANARDLFAWNDKLWDPINETVIVIDFSSSNFLSPFSLIFCINQIGKYKKLFPGAQFKYENYDHLTWARRMGFFSNLRDCSWEGEEIHASTSDNFLPVTTIDKNHFLTSTGLRLDRVAMNIAIDGEAASLARALTHLDSGYTFDVIQYSLREIIRNVFEHSGASTVRFCAQYWPSRGTVEIVIADDGMGIHSSLTMNPTFSKLTERQALQYCCLPGISGNAAALKEKSVNNPWQNSGYGLYMTSRFCRNGGDFMIVSSNNALVLKDSKLNFPLKNTSGTIIRMHFNLTGDTDLSALLKRFSEEGKKAAEHIRGAKVINASVASQMLRRDFLP